MQHLFLAAVFAGLMWTGGELGLFEAQADVGQTPTAGSAQFDASTKTYRVSGGGGNISLKEDAFHFVYRQATGDISLSADVSLQGSSTEPHRIAALMIRQNLNVDSPFADIAIHGDGSTALEYRPGGGVESAEFRLAMKTPRTIAIQRRKNEITVSAGDGLGKPATNGPIIVTMSDPVFVGLAVSSHKAGVLETAMFTNVMLQTSKATATLQLIAKHGREWLPPR